MRRLVAAPALAYASIGLAALVRPAMVPAQFGGTAPTSTARTEIRAVYGGLPLALAGLIATGGRPGRRAAAVASGGMAAGRLAGALLERDLRPWPTGFWLGVEVALAGALAAADR